MSNENVSLILSICGIAAVVGVMIILAGFLVVRILKGSLFGMAMMAMKIFSEPKEEPGELDARAQSAARPRNIDLRTQARSVDFDSAVARYSNGQQPTTPTAPVPPGADVISAQNAPMDSRPPVLKNRRRRLKGGGEEGEDADFMENFLGE